MTLTQFIKLVVFSVLAVVVALVFSYSFQQFISTHDVTWLIWTGVSVLVFQTFFILQGFFIKNWKQVILIALAEAAALGAFFYSTDPSFVLVITILLVWAFFIFAKKRGEWELKNNLSIRFFRTADVMMSSATTAIAIFAAVFYLSFINFQDPAIFNRVMASTGNIIPGFSLDETLEEAIERFSSQEGEEAESLKLSSFLPAALLPEGFDIALPNIKSQLVKETSDRLAKAASDFTNTEITAQDEIGEILYTSTVRRFSALSERARTSILFGVGFFLYLSVRFLLFILGWISVFAGFGLYQILYGLGFFKISTESKSKEIIVL